MLGRFSENGRPVFDIELYGISEKYKKNFAATFDTGYTGFLAIPFTEASRLGLILVGTESYTLADGSNKTDLSCLGQIIFDGRSIIGTIDVSFAGGSILLGMTFLRNAGLSLYVDPENDIAKLEKSTHLLSKGGDEEAPPNTALNP